MTSPAVTENGSTIYDRIVQRRGGPLPPVRAANRLSAYIYGNILTCASVAIATPDGIDDGSAAALVLGTAATTFVAHIFADMVAHTNIPDSDESSNEDTRRIHLGEHLRDAVPIASSAFIPAFILLLGWLGVLSPLWAQLLAGAVVIVRIAGVQIATQRIRGNGLSLRYVIAGLVTAGLAAAIVVIKVLVTH
ncbi:hypothetical protein [Antrihabitans spumae]|uniref:VIT family protein n=1 Tax=Antrihabitans spumae TaxID=3373370 RepID=A0ABW7JZ38_9NOCA